MAADRVAIIVISYNTKELLLECLSSATRNGPGADIIVVDNASTDGSAAAVRREFPVVSVMENETNRGFAAACNQAMGSHNADFFLLLNSDAVLSENALPALLSCMSVNPRAGAAGCRVVNGSGSTAPTTMNFLTGWNQSLELLGIKIGALRRTRTPVADPGHCDCSIDWLEGSCLLLRKSALDQVGTFDEQFFMYSEDEDLCWRMKKAGWAICYTDAARVTHRSGASAAGDRAANLAHFYSSQIKLLRKHRSAPHAKLFMITTAIALRIKLLLGLAFVRREDVANLRLRLRSLREGQSLAGRLPPPGPAHHGT